MGHSNEVTQNPEIEHYEIVSDTPTIVSDTPTIIINFIHIACGGPNQPIFA